MKLGTVIGLLIYIVYFVPFHIPNLSASNSDSQIQIDQINERLEVVKDSKGKAKLYTYRARSYAKSGKKEQAKNDYITALNASYEGWILNELGYFMFNIGEFEKAYNVSTRVLNDFPHLRTEATKLQVKARKKWEEEYLKNNPPTITIDTVPDPARKSRHDMINQKSEGQGTYRRSNNSSTESSKPISEHWGNHPATKHIPVPERKSLDIK